MRRDSNDFPHPPSSFYCDFSEPVTPSLLSHDTPPLTNVLGKKWHPRPPTPPPNVDGMLEDEESVFVNECGDANNNGSNTGTSGDETVYEEIMTSFPGSSDSADIPAFNVTTDKEIQSPDGSIVSSPQFNQSTISIEIDMNSTESNTNTNGSVNGEETLSNEHTGNSTSDVPLQQGDEQIPAKNCYVALASPPNYPTPRRKDSTKEDARKGTFSEMDDTSSMEESKQATPCPIPESKYDPVNVSDDSQSLGKFQNVEDPATIRKLQETEDLIQYFRQKRREIVGESGDGSTSSVTDNFDAPIVVSDLAAGNKRLRRAEKAAIKNRKSWGGVDNVDFTEDPGSMSMSTPDLPSLSKRKKQSIFR